MKTSPIVMLILLSWLWSACSPAVTMTPAAETPTPGVLPATGALSATPQPTSVLPLSTYPPESEGKEGPHCRFGITAPKSVAGYDIASLKVGALLDWRMGSPPPLPAGVEYIHVIRLRDRDYEQLTPDALTALLQANPGAYWIVGNEPDTTYEDQDGLLPEVYAERYFTIASRIRAADPTARLGFGTIVQPTPLRIRYLERAWQRLSDLAGSREEASALIDFWSIHAFILNEWPDEWGTGVPPGFEDDYADAVHYTESPYAETYSVDIFSQRVENFRAWMASIGERNKPLWITEFGSLFPPKDPPDGPDFLNLPEAATGGYLFATFDYLMSASDPKTGLPADENRLVQRWFWYSLNDNLYRFGGSLYDPDRGGEITVVGRVFLEYMKRVAYGVDLHPYQATWDADGRLQVAIGNSGSTAFDGQVIVQVLDGEHQETVLALDKPQLHIEGCGGTATVHLAGVPRSRPLIVQVITAQDINNANNALEVQP